MSTGSDTGQQLEKGRISALQFGFLAVTLVIATADVFLPSYVAQEAQEDSWLSVIMGTASSLLIAMVFVTLALRYPDKTIIQYACDILGKPLGKLVGFMYIYYLLYISYTVTRELGEIFVTSFNPDSPLLIYSLITIAVAAYAVSKGLEVIARANEFIIPIGLGILGLIAVVNIKETDLHNFLPVLANGIVPPMKGGILLQGWILETVLLLQFVPFIKDKKKVRKSFTLAIITLGISMELGVLTIAVFGKLTGKLIFPALEYVRFASIGEYIKNLDITIMGVWITGIFIKIAISYYAFVFGTAQLLGFKSFKPIIIPAGILIISLSIAPSERITDIINFTHYIFPFYSFSIAFFIPSLLLAVSYMRKKHTGKQT